MASSEQNWVLEELLGAPVEAPDSSKKSQTSFFEFWPMWLMYAPVAIQWALLALRHRSITLPFIANPNVTLSGMVGMPKSELFAQAQGALNEHILPWILVTKDRPDSRAHADAIIRDAEEAGICLPFVCKPDIGCRGVGVKRVQSAEQLSEILSTYPQGAQLLIQKLSQYEPEAGLFFIKNPESGTVSIPSMTFKFTPSVVGDGIHTLGELVEKDPRAGRLIHLYKDRLQSQWDSVIAAGESAKLVFSASHSKGAIFKDARTYVTPALTAKLDELMSHLPEFYYGRLDVKFRDIASLQRGESLEIVEINGASSESIHIWDRDAKFSDAIKQLLWQYRTLFKMGASHRKRGLRPPGLRFFFQRLFTERRLTRNYPTTD